MNYFKEYMLSVCAIIMLTSVLSEILVDVSWSKYINLICGILFAVCLFNPLTNLFERKPVFGYMEPEIPYIAKDFVEENVKKEFSLSLSEMINKDIKTRFNINTTVSAGVSEDGIYIIFDKNANRDVVEYVKREYKPDIIKISGG